jgi:uncharacterized protein YidB (DUF937 family)
MDVLLGGDTGGLGKILTGKNSSLILTLLPLLLGMLGSKSGSESGSKSGKSGKSGKSTKSGGRKSSSQSGLEDLIGGFTSGGLGDIVGSWIGGGPNKSISAAQVKQGLGAARLNRLSKQSGLSTGEVAEGLTTLLPVVVNMLTPKAEVPVPSALDSALQGLSGLLPRS